MKFISYIQAILGSIGLIISFILFVIYLIPALKYGDLSYGGWWPLIVVPMVSSFMLAVPQFIAGIISILNRKYSKKAFIILAIFFIQIYFFMELYASSPTVPVFSYRNGAGPSRNQIGLYGSILFFIVNILAAFFLNKFHKIMNKKISVLSIILIIILVFLILILTGKTLGYGLGFIYNSHRTYQGSRYIDNTYWCVGVLVDWNCFGYSVRTR